MKLKPIKQMLTALLLGLVLVSCGPAYVGVNGGYGPRYGYNDRPNGYYSRPNGYYRRPPVIVTPPPRVYYRNQYRNYRPAPPAYGRRYSNPGHGNGRTRGYRR